MSLKSLSTDSLRHVCQHLDVENLSHLYATNDRILMRKLISPGVCPHLDVFIDAPIVLRFITSHTSLQSLNCSIKRRFAPNELPPAFEFERPNGLFGSPTVRPRLLLRLPRSLTSLDFNVMLSADPTLQTTETFASLFPELRTLILRDPSPYFSPVHVLVDQLRKELPPTLETLGIQTSATPPALEVFPRSITALHLSNPRAMVSLAGYPSSQPTFRLIQQLHEHLPELTTLSVQLASLSRTASSGPKVKIVPLLPKLLTLNIQAQHPSGKEYANIISSLPSVEVLVLGAMNFQFSEDEGTSKSKSEADDVPSAPAAAGFGGGGGGFGGGFGGPGGGFGGPPPHAYSHLVPSILPPRLVSLTLSSSQLKHSLVLSQRLMRSLPPSLESLTVIACTMPWALPGTSEGWDPLEEASNAVLTGGTPTVPPAGFGRGTRRTPAQAPGDETGPSWLSLLPAKLLNLHICDVPLQVIHLPPNLRSLRVDRPTETPYLAPMDVSEFKIGKPGHKSALVWPKNLTSLHYFHERMSLADALSLPPSLTDLKIHATQDWDQRGVAALLAALPNCYLDISLTYVWIIDVPSDNNASESPDAAARSELVVDGKLSLLKLLEHRIRDVPTRVNAQWHPSTPKPAPKTEEERVAQDSQRKYTGPRVPDFMARFTIPSDLDFTAIELPAAAENISHARGSFEFMIGGFEDIMLHLDGNKVRAVRQLEVPQEHVPFNGLTIPFAHFQQLTSLYIPSIFTTEYTFSFSMLPRTLVDFVFGPKPGFNAIPDTPYDLFNAWKYKYNIAVSEKPPANSGPFTFTTSSFNAMPDLTPVQRRRQRRVDDLPRGLVRLGIAPWTLDPECDGEWPAGLTELSFYSYFWTDTAIINVYNRLPHLKSMKVVGGIVSYGSMPLDDGESSSMDCDDPSAAPSESLPPLVTSLDCIDASTLKDAIYAPFKARNITLQQVVLPSLKVLVRSSTHTLNLNSGPFAVDHNVMLQNEYMEHTPTGTAKPWTVASPGSFGGFGSPILHGFDVSVKEEISISSLAQHHSLTHFSSNICPFTWDRVSQLPETLKHLSLNILDSVVVDPFIRLPRFLESLQLDCSNTVALTAAGLAQIPPNLTMLECSRMTFNPSLIADFPQQVSTLLFDACDLWNDLDVYELKRHLGDGLKSLNVGHCEFSGALLPLSESTDISMLTCSNLTKERLGPKVKVTWQTVSSPLRFCALDFALQATDGVHTEILSLSTLPVYAVDHMRSLDLHLVPLQNLRSTLPSSLMPSNLTSLTVRLAAFLRPADAVSLPKTLKYFNAQLYSSFTHINSATWHMLPRSLETIIVDFLGFESSSYGNTIGSMPLCILEPGLVEYSSVRNPQVKRPNRNRVYWLDTLQGLPPSLQTLSLRPYGLSASCGVALPPALRTLECFDFYLREDKRFIKAHPNLKVRSTDPGAASLFHAEGKDQGREIEPKDDRIASFSTSNFDFQARERPGQTQEDGYRHFNSPCYDFH